MGFFKPAEDGEPPGAQAGALDEGDRLNADEATTSGESADVEAALGRSEEDPGASDLPTEI
jgi:hypothetical protein